MKTTLSKSRFVYIDPKGFQSRVRPIELGGQQRQISASKPAAREFQLKLHRDASPICRGGL